MSALIMDPRIKHDAGQKYQPYYIRVGGKKRYFKTSGQAELALKQQPVVAQLGRAETELGPRAIREYRTAKAMLPPGTSLVYVAEQFMRANRMDMTRTVATAIDEYLKVRSAEPNIRPRYLYRIRQLMKWYRELAGNTALAGINYGDVEQACLSCGTPHKQHNARTHLSVFFSFCFRRQWIDKNPADARIVTLVRRPRPEVEFLPVEQVKIILHGAWEHARDLVAPFAIQLFCGVRTEEVTRLWWDSVKLDSHIDIAANVSKTGERRVIDWWPDNLTSWLKPLKAETGLVAPHNYSVRRALLMKKINVTPPHNAFRHSYATYGVAYHQDAAKIALMLGHHDQHLIYKHYRAYATEEQGKAYFALSR